MFYLPLGTESTKSYTHVFFAGQSFSTLFYSLCCRDFSGFQLNSLPCHFFLGKLGENKNRRDSTETLENKSPEKNAIFL